VVRAVALDQMKFTVCGCGRPAPRTANRPGRRASWPANSRCSEHSRKIAKRFSARRTFRAAAGCFGC